MMMGNRVPGEIIEFENGDELMLSRFPVKCLARTVFPGGLELTAKAVSRSASSLLLTNVFQSNVPTSPTAVATASACGPTCALATPVTMATTAPKLQRVRIPICDALFLPL